MRAYPLFSSVLAALLATFGNVCAQQPVSIMCLGDSLTWGYDGITSTGNLAANTTPGGYRAPLYTLLEGEGYDVNYVGAGNANAGAVLTAAGQTAQNGYNDFTISELATDLNGNGYSSSIQSNNGGYLLNGVPGPNRTAVKPDIILLQIGVNDLAAGYTPAQATARLQSFLNILLPLESQADVLVSGSTPAFNQSNTAVYGQDVQSMLLTSFSKYNIHYVDMQTPFRVNGMQNLALFNDSIHPNEAGYDLMASVWNQAILDDFVAVPEPSTLALVCVGTLGVCLVQLRRRLTIRL